MHAPAHPTPAQQAMQDDDMFAADVAAPLDFGKPATAHLQFTGQLVRNADVRTEPALDGLHTVPVVCVQLKSTEPGVRRTCYAQQAFTDATRRDAEALAARLKKGQVITVSAKPTDTHTTFRHAQLIEQHD